MKRTLSSFTLAILLLATTAALTSHAQRKPAGAKPSAQKGKGKAATKATPAKPADEDALKAELDEVLKLDAAARVERLKAFDARGGVQLEHLVQLGLESVLVRGLRGRRLRRRLTLALLRRRLRARGLALRVGGERGGRRQQENRECEA